MINVVLAILAAGLVVEARTDGDRMVGGVVLSASLAAMLRNVEIKP